MFVEQAKNRQFFGKHLNGNRIISETPKGKMPSDNPLSYNKRGARSSALLKYDKSNSMLGSQSRENFSSRLRLPSNRTDNFIKYEPDKN